MLWVNVLDIGILISWSEIVSIGMVWQLIIEDFFGFYVRILDFTYDFWICVRILDFTYVILRKTFKKSILSSNTSQNQRKKNQEEIPTISLTSNLKEMKKFNFRTHWSAKNQVSITHKCLFHLWLFIISFHSWISSIGRKKTFNSLIKSSINSFSRLIVIN